MTADIIVSIWTARREAQDGFTNEYAHFAAVAAIDNRPELYNPRNFLAAEDSGWQDFTEYSLCETLRRKTVRVELPGCVHHGQYKIANCTMTGFYGDFDARNGLGSSAIVHCNRTVRACQNRELEAAIDKAISSGITLSVPSSTGGFEDFPAKVVAVSPIFSDTEPDISTWTGCLA